LCVQGLYCSNKHTNIKSITHNNIAIFSLKKPYTIVGFEPGPSFQEVDACFIS
jgi:hypothetical protein